MREKLKTKKTVQKKSICVKTDKKYVFYFAVMIDCITFAVK